MKLAVYALTSEPAGRVPLRGVAREGLRAIRVGPISAIVGEVAKPPAASEPNLRRYATLIARVAATRPAVLPVRFGTLMEDEDELASVLRSRQQVIRTQLAHVRGRVQMTVRIVTAPPVAVSRGRRDASRSGGAAYLNARAKEQRADSIPEFAPLHAAVGRWVKDERVERHGKVATVYHLIAAAAASRYADALERAAVENGVQGFVSGPWPPYAFADRW
jgi:hypothetical protein